MSKHPNRIEINSEQFETVQIDWQIAFSKEASGWQRGLKDAPIAKQKRNQLRKCQIAPKKKKSIWNISKSPNRKEVNSEGKTNIQMLPARGPKTRFKKHI